jgi:hypothetical protein
MNYAPQVSWHGAVARGQSGEVSELVGRASLDLATLGLKAPSAISPSVPSCRSRSCCCRSTMVSSKMAKTQPIALRRRRTESLGQMLGRIRCSVAVIPITRLHG